MGICDVGPGTYTAQKATMHQVTTMLATSKNVLFPGQNTS